MTVKDPACDYEKCPSPADFVFYPNKRRVEELALYLCLYHREEALDLKEPKQELYDAAHSLIGKSIAEAT